MSIYIGTGGYSDTDFLGILYHDDNKKTEFLTEFGTFYKISDLKGHSISFRHQNTLKC